MDGDGDRLVVVDKNSRVLDGDDILYTIIRGKKINNEKIKGVCRYDYDKLCARKLSKRRRYKFY